MTEPEKLVELVEEIKPYAYFKQQMVHQVHHFYLTGEVGEPELYIDMVHAIRMAGSEEAVVIHLNTNGGNLATGVQLVNAIEASQAHVICIVEGECHSLGTLIFLAADEFMVHDHCMMMFHNFSGGVFGKGHEQMSQLQATQEWFSTLARKLYIPFMTEEEFQKILDGQDMWIQSDEIRKRLLTMVKCIEDEKEESGELLLEDKKPRKKRAAKSS
jgi:ATP-dependent protease ClpP protease subunit